MSQYSPSMAYQLREKKRTNYKEIENVKVPRARAIKKKDKLYDLEVIEEDEYTGRVKVHYIDYGAEHDEWRDKTDIVITKPPTQGKQYPPCANDLKVDYYFHKLLLLFSLFRVLYTIPPSQ